MTLHAISERPKKKQHTLTAGNAVFGVFAIFCLLLILRNSDIAIEYMSRGLLLCARTVIPSLFPFMVLSELIVSGGIGASLLRRIAAPFRRLFGLPDAGCCAVMLGMLCGFPVGAKCAVLSYEQGSLTREETERVLTFSNNPSSAFLISAVGVSLWGNRQFGIALYATVLISAVLTGILVHLLYQKGAKKKRPRVKDPLGSRTAPERLQAVYRSGKISYGQYPIGVRLRRFFLHVRRNTQPRARNLSDPHAMDRRPVLSV